MHVHISVTCMEQWWKGTERRNSKCCQRNLPQFQFVYHKSRINRPRSEYGALPWHTGDYPPNRYCAAFEAYTSRVLCIKIKLVPRS